jgi:hypothetical protein
MAADESVLQYNNNMQGGGVRSLLPPMTQSPRASVCWRFSRLVVVLGAAFENNNSENAGGSFKAGTNGVEENKFSNFNPFDYKSSHSNSAYSYSGTQISLRKTQMQELVNDLLNVVQENNKRDESSDAARIMQEMLQSSKDMLLEPLEDVANAVLDPDSIYTPTMTRGERYQAYRASMEERLRTARNPQVQRVLQELKDFVLSFE